MGIKEAEKVDVRRMYDELTTYYRINSSWKYANRNLLKTVMFVTKLDDETYLGFQTPDQVYLFDDWDGSNGVVTGIDFETGLELLEPYMRREKISKLINKTSWKI